MSDYGKIYASCEPNILPEKKKQSFINHRSVKVYAVLFFENLLFNFFCQILCLFLNASHYMVFPVTDLWHVHIARDRDRDRDRDRELMGSNILYRTVHIAPGPGMGRDPLSSIVLIPFPVPVPVPVPCSVNEPLDFLTWLSSWMGYFLVWFNVSDWLTDNYTDLWSWFA